MSSATHRVESEDRANYGLKPYQIVERSILRQATEILQRQVETKQQFHDPEDAGLFFQLKLKERPAEVFSVLFLDTRHRLIAYEELFHGTLDGAEVHPRIVAQRALILNAAAVIFGHNHPSGECEPSSADRKITDRLRDALALLDVRVLDHFVVGNGKPVSMAARGWI